MNSTNRDVYRLSQLFCFWSAPLGMVLFFVGLFVMCRLLPPFSPGLSAEEVVARYGASQIRFLIGIALILLATGIQIPFNMLLVSQMERMKGISTAYKHTVLGASVCNIVLTFIPMMLFGVAAFRLERDPQLTMLLNDMAWLCFVTPVGSIVVEALVLGIAMLLDKQDRPIFPRFVGYFCIWFAIIGIPGAIAMVFKTGPFAWNGLFAFWLPLVFGGNFIGILLVYVWKDMKRQYAEAAEIA